MSVLGWLLVTLIAAGKFACFGIAVRNALRPKAIAGTGGDIPGDGPDWDFWERDLLDPGPEGGGANLEPSSLEPSRPLVGPVLSR